MGTRRHIPNIPNIPNTQCSASRYQTAAARLDDRVASDGPLPTGPPSGVHTVKSMVTPKG